MNLSLDLTRFSLIPCSKSCLEKLVSGSDPVILYLLNGSVSGSDPVRGGLQGESLGML